MKILVTIKRVPDPELKVKLKDGAIDLSGASWVVNTFDEYAVETALRLREHGETNAPHAEVVVVTIGPEDAGQQLRSALAMGADRAIRIEGKDDALDARVVATALAKLIETEQPDLVVMGKQAVDGDANQVGQMLAGKLGWPQATFAATVELSADKTSLTVGREVDAGVEYKTIALPGVLTVDLRVVAAVLAKVIEAEKPDLVVMGKQAVDGDANQVGQMLAGKLGWPQATFAATVELAADKASLTVGREVDAGVEYKTIALPGVLTVDLRVVAPTSVKNNITPASHSYGTGEGGPRYASLKGIMAAKKKPMEQKSIGDYGVDVTPATRERGVTLPAARAAGQKVADIPTLVKKLVDEAKAL